MDYAQVLRNHIIYPLVKNDADGVDQAVGNMGDYSLLREDLDGLVEITQWPGNPDPMAAVDRKTKAAFTKKYNKERATLPFSIAQTVSKKKGRGDVEDMKAMDDNDGEEDKADDTLEKDGMIKMKRQKVVGRREEQGCRAKANGKRSAASDK